MDVSTQPRLRSLDVVRGIALFGVIALNYHAMLNGEDAFAPLTKDFLGRVFNPVTGVLTTRFAATFVFVAGIGVTLLASRANHDDPTALHRVRVTLLRRGAFLLLIGSGLEWMWPGTILFYYGAYFILASVLVGRSTRTLVFVACSSVVVAAGINLWRVSERYAGNYTAWLDPTSITTPRAFLLRLLVGYTHPVFPWIAFFIGGMVVGRARTERWIVGTRQATLGTGLVVLCYILRDGLRPSLIVNRTDELRAAAVSLQPFDRGVLYVLSTLGIAVVSTWMVERLVARAPRSLISTGLARMGRMSLTVYTAHIVVYKMLVDVLGVVRPTGLDTALGFAVVTFTFGIGLSSVILTRWTHGPMEWLYRKIDYK